MFSIIIKWRGQPDFFVLNHQVIGFTLFCVLYTHVQQINMKDLYPHFRDFRTPDKMVATAMQGVKVANRQIIYRFVISHL